MEQLKKHKVFVITNKIDNLKFNVNTGHAI